mmetsp:Transcript_8602/g.25847  ORF Transcript_8602/g.25847 Transcript_8602/m.25847 type:complete len:472 (-) Transcript_8602:867-2282(-)|eukprot:CAMPEP_0198732790 /NCGR_PEP_ID=MMETSP1475-20131203/39356_1 /TAXON_ID= ORGANISM="Unidentified sp., Strain CCMP1999" /NCGR_SAMPLE_ID=MMETSP1475 /ASSEMBLY_ACC=CAM_ASM_001111 /LENGTH=471 /DNA_ID=CAMNT_0044495961 /DNA_START=92 /DNA_END=1507 /DNA_ORIENTATION=+
MRDGENQEEEVASKDLQGLPEILCVELPGAIGESADGAIDALGSWEAIEKVLVEGEGSLSLRLREGHGGVVTSNPAQTVSDLLCDGNGNVEAVVTQTVRFEALSDFTYEDRGSRTLEGFAERILDPDDRDMAVLRPSKMSHYDHPRLDRDLKGLFRNANDRAATRGYSFARYDDPQVPTTGCSGENATVETVELLSVLFNERPMWMRSRLTHEPGVSERKDLIHALRAVAYRFVGSGPFRFIWIRLGYDPRQDPINRIYQSVDLRFHPLGEVASVWADQWLIPNRLVAKGDDAMATRGCIGFQLCDIDVPKVKRVMEEATYTRQLTTAKHGFFEAASFASIIQAIKADLFDAIGYRAEPKIRKRKPMMEKFRYKQRTIQAKRHQSGEQIPSAADTADDEIEVASLDAERAENSSRNWDKPGPSGHPSAQLRIDAGSSVLVHKGESWARDEASEEIDEYDVLDDDSDDSYDQ